MPISSTEDVSRFFNGARLTMARKLSGKTKSELAETLGKSPTAISAWESGLKKPTAKNVAALSIGLNFPPAFFSAPDSGCVETLPHYRALRSTTRVQRDHAEAYAHLVNEFSSAIERLVEFPDVDVPTIPAPDSMDTDAPERAARKIRVDWGLGQDPIPHMIRLLENHGVLVVFSPVQAAALDAYSVQTGIRPVIVLNPEKKDYYRQRFDVAHELGHIVMHTDAEPGGKLVEEQANRFASELLMPSEIVFSQLPSSMNNHAWRMVKSLKEEWLISMQAILMAARKTGKMRDAVYRNAMISLTKWGWRRNEPGEISILEQPSLLPRAVEVLQEAGYSLRSISDLGHIPFSLFMVMVSRIPRLEEKNQEMMFEKNIQEKRNFILLSNG